MNPELLHALHDGELDPATEAEVRRALERDPSLRAAYEAIESTDRALETLDPLEVGPEFTERVLRMRRARDRGRVLRWVVPLAAAAALVLAVRVWGPGGAPGEAARETWSLEPAVGYAWETDRETFGSLSLDALEDEILAELEIG